MYYPEVVRIDLTGDCNLRCRHCQTSMFLKKAAHDLGTTEWKRIISEVAAAGGLLVTFLGGEPLLRDDAVELVEHARSVGLRVAITTNGTTITADLAKSLVRSTAYLGVSFDGPDGSSHDRMRGKGSFDRAIEGLRTLLHARAGDEAPQAAIGISATLNRYSHDRFERFVDLAIETGASSITISEVHDGGRASRNWENIRISTDEMRHAAVRFITRCHTLEFKGELRLDFFTARFRDWIETTLNIKTDRPMRFDNSGMTECYIQHDGIMFPSQQVSEMKPGNMAGLAGKLGIEFQQNDLKTTGFHDIWNGPAFRRFREFVASKSYWQDYAGCQDCRHLGMTCDPGTARWLRDEATPHPLCRSA